MLGDIVGELQGRIMGNRVLPYEGPSPKIESSFQQSGKILGVDVTDIGTYVSTARAWGVLYGEANGVIMTKDNDVATYTAQGIGKFIEGGAATWRGSLFFQTMSKKLAHLNSIAVLFEYEVDENGNTQAKLWEWK